VYNPSLYLYVRASPVITIVLGCGRTSENIVSGYIFVWLLSRFMVQWNYSERVGVVVMSIIAGIIVCAFVYVIRESIAAPNEEDYRT
jgi:hypothetical protein